MSVLAAYFMELTNIIIIKTVSLSAFQSVLSQVGAFGMMLTTELKLEYGRDWLFVKYVTTMGETGEG